MVDDKTVDIDGSVTDVDLLPVALEVVIEGKVTASNLADFKTSIMQFLEERNLTLETKEDFSEAETFVENLKKFEAGIAEAKKRALESTADINNFFREIDELETAVRSVRESQENQIKKEQKRVAEEKRARIAEIINTAKKSLLFGTAPLTHRNIIHVNLLAVDAAAKNKKTLETLQKTVDIAVEEEVARCELLNAEYSSRWKRLEDAEREHIGLFPDKETLVKKSDTELSAIMAQRIAEAKLAKHTKESSAPQSQRQAGPGEDINLIHPKCSEPVTLLDERFYRPPSAAATLFNAQPPPPQETEPARLDQPELFEVVVQIRATKERAIELARDLDAYSSEYDERVTISLRKATK